MARIVGAGAGDGIGTMATTSRSPAALMISGSFLFADFRASWHAKYLLVSCGLQIGVGSMKYFDINGVQHFLMF